MDFWAEKNHFTHMNKNVLRKRILLKFKLLKLRRIRNYYFKMFVNYNNQ